MNFEEDRKAYLSELEDIKKHFNTIKNKTKHPLYKRWINIKDKSFKKRNIKMCEEWHSSFDSFVGWCYNNGYDKKLALVRIDFNKGYSPDNCRFEDIKITNQRQAEYYKSAK